MLATIMADVVVTKEIEDTALRLGVDLSTLDLDAIRLPPGEDCGLLSHFFSGLQPLEQVLALLIRTMADSIRTNPIMAQIHEGKEPAQFFSILQRLIILKGGNSSGYMKFIEEKGIVDETYNENLVALFRVQGASPDNMQAIQVDQVSTSLNSSYCYILQSKASIYTWIGILCSVRDHNLLDRMVELSNPTWLPVSLREGNKPDIFWDALGGKAETILGEMTWKACLIDGSVSHAHLLEFQLRRLQGIFLIQFEYDHVTCNK
ncbi:Villin-3 [Glycine soja]